MPTPVAHPKNENTSKSKLPIPIVISTASEKTTSKIKCLKNFTLKSWEGLLEKNPVPEPRMTRSSSLRRANSMKRFNNKNRESNGGSPPALSRCGTGGSLERPSARRSFRKCNLESRSGALNSTSENNSPK